MAMSADLLRKLTSEKNIRRENSQAIDAEYRALLRLKRLGIDIANSQSSLSSSSNSGGASIGNR